MKWLFWKSPSYIYMNIAFLMHTYLFTLVRFNSILMSYSDNNSVQVLNFVLHDEVLEIVIVHWFYSIYLSLAINFEQHLWEYILHTRFMDKMQYIYSCRGSGIQGTVINKEGCETACAWFKVCHLFHSTSSKLLVLALEVLQGFAFGI